MSGNFSLTDLFKAGLDKDKFIQTHSDMKADGATGSSSIFADGTENFTGNIFDTIDINKNGKIDEDEITALERMGQKGEKDKIDEDDLTALYQKTAENILSKYGADLNPQTMFNTAVSVSQNNGGMVSSDYIQTLEEDIESLNELIDKTKSESDKKVEDLRNEIDDFVQQSSKLDAETKAKHKEKTEELNKLKKEKTEYETKIAKAKAEQKEAQNQVTLLNREIEKLNPEKDADKIAQKQEELKTYNGNIKNLSENISSYQNKLSEIAKNITSTQNELKQIQASCAEKDGSLKDKISQKNAAIKTEQADCDKKTDSYKQRLEALQNAKDYAYQNMEVATCANEDGSSITNKPGSVEELEQAGIPYSSEKGKKLAQNIKQNLKGFTGHCSRSVSNSLAASGLW